jgi:signal transduction histidine kinase/ActR/RegA family two-component response regulator
MPVAATIVSLAAGYALQLTVGYRFPLIAFYPPVMLSAWFGGFWPGATATGLSILVVDQMWLAPLRAANLSNAGDPIALVLFLGVGLAMSGFSESLHRSTARESSARRRAEESEGHLRAALFGEHTARVDAEAANRLKDQFLAMVSHELRTPLNALLGWADMLKSDVLPEPRRRRAIEAIHANAARQAQLVDDLLDVARLMSGKLPLRCTSIEFGDVLRAAMEIVQPAADAKQIELAVDASPRLRAMYADPVRLQQVVWNLLSNAIKFTPPHGVVSVRVAEDGDQVELSVADTGQGIPDSLLQSIFEPFQQVDSSTTREHGGLGLGLSIVKYVVEAHGGTVTALSAGEGRGAVFVVRLPVIPYARPAAAVPPSSVAVITSPVIGATVLVVDDDADSREVIAAQLEAHGVRVVTVSSAPEAMSAIERERPSAMLIDLAMPDEDGFALIRRIRSSPSPAIASIPAAAVTALARDEDRERAIEAGFQEHIAKPIAAAELMHTLARLVAAVQA